MPVRERRPGDEKPLFRAVNGQQLFRTAGGEPEEAAQEQPRASAGGQAAPQAGQAEGGPVARALDKAQQNNWVYGSVANTLRETGLVARADELLSKLHGG